MANTNKGNSMSEAGKVYSIMAIGAVCITALVAVPYTVTVLVKNILDTK